MKKTSLCIIFGGKSTEYSVSLLSAYNILTNIDKEKYELHTIGITKEGKWYLFIGDYSSIENDSWWKNQELIFPCTIDISTGNVYVFNKKSHYISIDKYFPVIHGELGEDGKIQAILDASGASYVGCDFYSSFVCMNKHLTKATATELKIPVARSFTIYKSDTEDMLSVIKEASKIGYPVFVKPSCSGSSIGISRVETPCRLYPAIINALKYSSAVIIEEQIKGSECEIGAIEMNGQLVLTDVGRIKYNSDFYDYETKYYSNGVLYEIPANISKEAAKLIEKYAKALFIRLGLKDLSRIDFFVTDTGAVIFNEINTMPGFTSSSMLPMLLKEQGINISSLIDILTSS